jgi:putative hemolysin
MFLIEYYENHDVSLNELIQEPLIFPSSLRAQKVLETFRDKHKSFAVVVDEYGSLDGIITLHDIFETLVGTLVDENENEEPDIFMRNDHSALVNGEAPLEILTLFLDDFHHRFRNYRLFDNSGIRFVNINKIPQVGDKFVYDNAEFEIVDVDGNKIDKVLITKKQKDSK